jgi:hypothetical protein
MPPAQFLLPVSPFLLSGISIPAGNGLPSAFRGPKAEYRVRASVRIDAFGHDICKTAPDEAGKKFHAEAARDQEVLGAASRLSRDEFERPAFVGHNGPASVIVTRTPARQNGPQRDRNLA